MIALAGRSFAFFDVNDDVAVWFQRVVDALASAGRVSNVWRINASGRVTTTYQQKVNAGASTLINRADVRLGNAGPKILATNITVPTISCLPFRTSPGSYPSPI